MSTRPIKHNNILNIPAIAALIVLAAVAGGIQADEGSKALEIYCVDISASVGNATLIVSPSGETMLLDAGPP
jgi:hypothetical protein